MVHLADPSLSCHTKFGHPQNAPPPPPPPPQSLYFEIFGPSQNAPPPPPPRPYISKYLDPPELIFNYTEINGPPLKLLDP